MVVSVKAADIATALFAHLDTLGLPTAYPNRSFTPPANGQYLAAAFMPNRTQNLFVGNSAAALHQGLMQVTVSWPQNQGIPAALRVADRIVTHFGKGTALTAGDARLRIASKPSIAPPIQEANRLNIPVTIPWRTFGQ